MDTLPKTITKPEFTKTQKVYIQGWSLVARAKVLAMQGRRGEIADEIRRFLREAKKYEFNKLSAELCGFLQYYYYFIRGDKYRGKKYGDLRKKYDELSHIENQVENIYSEITYLINNTRNASKPLKEKLQSICDELVPLLDYDSVKVHLSVYALLNANAYWNEDYLGVIKNSTKIINYLEGRGIERTTNFYKDLTISLIITGNYKQGKKAINKAIMKIHKGSLSWSIYVYYRVVLEIYQANYQTAYSIFREAEKKKQINKAMIEQWKIVKGYFKFLINTNLIEGNSHFKISKFLNEVPVFSNDKEGNCINILILKIILNVGVNNDKVIDSVDSILRYIERHLKKHTRPKYFLKLLIQIPLGRFNRISIDKRGEKYLRLLRRKNTKGFNPDLEIIPYEILWPLVLSQLKKR